MSKSQQPTKPGRPWHEDGYRKMLAASERASSEPAGQPRSLAVATGSPAVPVCELENLAESWLHRHATSLEPTGNLLYCRDELRRLIAAAKKRQPQENNPVRDGASRSL